MLKCILEIKYKYNLTECIIKSDNINVDSDNAAVSDNLAPNGKLNFRVQIEKGALTPAPQPGAQFFEWYIITNPDEIDGEEEEGLDNVSPESVIDDSISGSDSEDDDDRLDEGNVQRCGQELEDIVKAQSLTKLPAPTSLLPGYEYTKFRPKPYDRNRPGQVRSIPTQVKALEGLEDLKKIIHPSRNTGRGYKNPGTDLWCRARLEGMQSLLNMFTNPLSWTYDQWGGSACQAAIGLGRGQHCARQLCKLARTFIADREVLPVNPYGDWNVSLLAEENIVNEINIYLLSLGNEITAKKLMDFLRHKDIKEKYAIERDISHKTACRYLHSLGYRFQSTPKGQYVDGHEREDVVAYRQKIFLPKWRQFMERMATWDKELKEYLPTLSAEQKRVIVWFHDESIFYAHDRRKRGWYHKDASPKPYAKGEGASLMIADFISADFGWLASPDGKKTARRIFKPGKNRDGYFTNPDILDQAKEATEVLWDFYPEYDHVFVYDNATTHLKRAEDALSAKSMPKGIPKAGTNWGIEVSKRDATGKLIFRPNGSVEKIKIQMRDAQFANGNPQPLYFTMDHPNVELRGKFK